MYIFKAGVVGAGVMGAGIAQVNAAMAQLDDLSRLTPIKALLPEEISYGQIRCVVEAWRHRTPGALAWGCGHAVVGRNRRQVKRDGTSQMYGDTGTDDFSHIEGYEDHGVDLLFTYDADRRPTGVVVNLACPAQVSEGDWLISADFWHETRLELRRRYGAELFVLPQCAPAGDQSPHLLLYAAIGIVLSFAAGYVASLLLPAPPRRLDGLTLHTLGTADEPSKPAHRS